MRDGSGWRATATDFPDLACRGRRLDRVEAAVRASVAALADAEIDDVELAVTVELTPGLDLAVADFKWAQSTLAQAQMEYNAMLFRAVRIMATEKISTRDAAHLLGLSHQRIAQIRAAS